MDVPQIRKLKPKLRKFLKRFDDCFPQRHRRPPARVRLRPALGHPREERRADRHQCRRAAQDLAGVPQPASLGPRPGADRSSRSSATSTPARTPSGSSTRPATSRRGTRPPACNGSGARRRQDGELHRHGPPSLRPRWLSLPARRRVVPARELVGRPRPLPRGRHPRRHGLPAQVEDRPGAVRPRHGQRPALRLADLRRGLRQQARVSAGAGGPRPKVRGRGAAELHGLDQGASGRHPCVPQARSRPRPQDASPGQRQSAGAAGRCDADRPASRTALVKWRVKDGQKGPMVWEVKHLRFSPVDETACRANRCT